ncbi:hypothetical protein KMZ32_19880 [Phycicoccus sp. MAQZ13P-2]|uniref:hypothetical protein n=1 Tax=Phycicoccus mangrovi TaxID=2840470 RepID=UPI001BFFEFD4|nr:hypothetical protein [Phycicoccus mangrovi]MBT9257163.1 hypothetical protein [Phycicoccus mangrovi]MBT9276338.1 hypothetical protein [Phycicoccus mangrovi]
MTTPDSIEPSVIALVNRDLGAAVRHASAHTLSPFVAAHRLEYELGPLRHRVELLALRRPDLLAELAAHWECPPDPRHLDEELTDHAHHLLVRRHAHAGGHLDVLTEPLRRSGDPGRLAASQERARGQVSQASARATDRRRAPR